MLQPFIRFEAKYIDGLKKLNKTFIVAQTYSRVVNQQPGPKPADLLFTDYSDRGLAKTHLNAVKEDPFACIIDLDNAKHEAKVREMLTGTKYNLYWSVVEDPKAIRKRLDARYMDHIRRYINSSTNWRIGADDAVQPSLQVIFGEIYIILKRGSQTVRVKFEDIEKS